MDYLPGKAVKVRSSARIAARWQRESLRGAQQQRGLSRHSRRCPCHPPRSARRPARTARPITRRARRSAWTEPPAPGAVGRAAPCARTDPSSAIERMPAACKRLRLHLSLSTDSACHSPGPQRQAAAAAVRCKVPAQHAEGLGAGVAQGCGGGTVAAAAQPPPVALPTGRCSPCCGKVPCWEGRRERPAAGRPAAVGGGNLARWPCGRSATACRPPRRSSSCARLPAHLHLLGDECKQAARLCCSAWPQCWARCGGRGPCCQGAAGGRTCPLFPPPLPPARTSRPPPNHEDRVHW